MDVASHFRQKRLDSLLPTAAAGGAESTAFFFDVRKAGQPIDRCLSCIPFCIYSRLRLLSSLEEDRERILQTGNLALLPNEAVLEALPAFTMSCLL